MEIDPTTLSPVERYRLLIGSVIPRPIAWITTVDEAGVVNLAPFSFFNGVTASPLTLMVSIGHRTQPKDTLANLRANGEAVVHLVPGKHLAACHQSGGEYAQGVSELEQLQLHQRPASMVRPPILNDAEIAMECRLVNEMPVGDPPASLVLLEVCRVHLGDDGVHPDGLPDPDRLRAVARLGDRAYLSAEGWQVVHEGKQSVPDELKRPRA